MKFVHIADVHIGMGFRSASFSKSFGHVKREGIKKNFKEVCDYINDEQVHLLLIAGDFLESDYVELRDLLDIKYLFEQMSKTQVVILTGNHDPQTPVNNPYTLISWSDNVHIIKTEYDLLELEELETSIIGVSWNSKGPMTLDNTALESTINKASGQNKILMLHGDCYQDSEYLALNPAYLNDLDIDYVALGHIHKKDNLLEKLVYPGSLEPLDFSETGSHGFVAGQLDEGKLVAEHVESMIYPMEVIDINVSGIESVFELEEKIKSYMSIDALSKDHNNTMYRIRLCGDLNPYLGQIKPLLEMTFDHEVYSQYIEFRDETSKSYDIESLYEDHKDDIIGYYIKEIKSQGLDNPINLEALHTGVSLLLEALGR